MKALKSYLVFIVAMLAFYHPTLAQTESNIAFFNSIGGLWKASPPDSSFVSELVYYSENKKFSLQVQNKLMSKKGDVFTHYEGTYFYNPTKKRIEFNTVNKSETHSGYCVVAGDTLYHFATIDGPGKVRSYQSAIIKVKENEINYYASYSDSEEIPDLKFNAPLIYYRQGQYINQTLFDQHYIEPIKQARKLVEELMKQKQIPGLSISISNKENVFWTEGFGFADLENNVPVRLNTKFRIGSISKTLTGIAIGKLIEDKKLSLEDPVKKFVPYWPEKKWEITVGELVSHTSGIRDYNYRNGEFLNRNNFKSIEESVSIFQNDSLLFQPGTKYSYSTYGYVLLSAVIEGASGMDYLTFMQDIVLSPMKLFNTVPDLYESIIENRSNFYDESNGEIVNGYFVNNSNKWAGGGYLSTSYELALLAQNLLNNQFLSESIKQLLWTPKVLSNGEKTNYGIGWRIDKDEKGRRYVHHGGSSIGGRAFLLAYPDQEIIIAITCNLSTNFDQYSLFKIAELFLE